MRRLAVLCLALVMFPLAAPAGMILLNPTMTDVGGGLYSYMLTFTADDASSADYNPDWLIGGADTETGYTGIVGSLNQVLVMGFLPTPTMTNAQYLAADLPKDTHWTLLDTDLLATTAPFESTSEIGGVFTIRDTARRQTMDLLQVVVASGATVNLNFKVSRATATGGVFSQDFTGTIVGGEAANFGGGGGEDPFDGNATADASNSMSSWGGKKSLTFDAGAAYNMTTVVVDTTGTGGGPMKGTTASLIGGTNGTTGTQTVEMAWRTRTMNETTDAEGGTPTSPPLPDEKYNDGLISDVLSLNGTGTQKYVLEMDYDPTLFRYPNTVFSEAELAAWGLIYLATYNQTTGVWENAILKNTPGMNAGTANIQDSWIGAGSPMTLGSWGVDTVNHKVWAVLDHNSQFAVIPEPATLSLLGLGGLVLLARRRRN